jgi:flagellar biosynthesis protein FlhA
MASVLLGMMAVMPGIPLIPFLALAGLTGGAAYFISSQQTTREVKQAEAAAAAAAAPAAPADEPISSALHIDVLRLELGYGLLPMINADKGPKVTEQIKALRRQIAADMGFVMPSVRIQDNIQLPSNQYVLRVKEIVAGRGELHPNQLLVMDPRGEQIQLPGEMTKEPTFGLPAM